MGDINEVTHCKEIFFTDKKHNDKTNKPLNAKYEEDWLFMF